ncbi:MAG: DNA replication protein DnaC, partial [Anaerostipes hadrus]
MSLSNNDYQDIMRQYEARRLSNYRLHEQRKKDIYTTIPEIRDLDRQITANYFLLLIIRDDPALREEYRKRIRLIRRNRPLKRSGYSSDYLEPIYHCKTCKDTGYIGQEQCSCFHQAMIDHLYSGSNMAKILARENFQTFREDYYSDQMTKQGLPSPRRNIQKVVEHCKTFISRFPNHDNILFQGSTGVGKTFLSHCIAKEIMDRGFTCVYMT